MLPSDGSVAATIERIDEGRSKTGGGIERYAPLSSRFGELCIIWEETESGPRVLQIALRYTSNSRMGSAISCPEIRELGKRIQAFLDGEPIDFDLEIVAIETCPDFQRRALLAVRKIPRGWVSTYGRMAHHLGMAKGARAVGRALARNPFPIVIPCHRVIMADGEIGGFRGGSEMKRALLKMEGVDLSVKTGKIYF
jgi:methylated-DNA-[protein]-cysteine S-methyltransferase